MQSIKKVDLSLISNDRRMHANLSSNDVKRLMESIYVKQTIRDEIAIIEYLIC